jgi:pseudouridine-5'-phosphate glycosidase
VTHAPGRTGLNREPDPDGSLLEVADEVLEAIDRGAAVVALESTIISHGLPRPENLRVAAEVEDIVRSRGAVPATIAILDGRVRIGLDEAGLEQVANRDDVVKVSVRDIATLVSRGGSGATTVAATSHLASLVGLRVFATGGLGGVHRQARDSWDESADLNTLAVTPMTVVCSGVKSILDVGATLERLETLNVGVLAFGTHRFPGFYLTDSGFAVDWAADDAADVAAIMRVRDALAIPSALVVANPLPEVEQLDPDVHDQVLEEGLRLAAARNVRGKDVTPFLLDHFHRATHGMSLIVNERIIVRNAELAARIAVADVSLDAEHTDVDGTGE